MPLTAGTRLGPYEILSPLGAGGMGEVYRAKDPRLAREVAIKVLPEPVATDPERLRRFEQETRAVGALNHPHILTVHDVGTHDGAPYVAGLGGKRPDRPYVAGPRREAGAAAQARPRGVSGGAAHLHERPRGTRRQIPEWLEARAGAFPRLAERAALVIGHRRCR